jgi:hypothetical protein
MTAKKIWGIVLIVLGVLAVLSGLGEIRDAQSMDQLVGNFVRQVGGTNAKTFQKALQEAQFAGIVRALIGVGLAIWGTWMVNDSGSKNAVVPIISNPQQGLSGADDFEIGEIADTGPKADFQPLVPFRAFVPAKCPECGRQMKVREITKGNSAGKRFLVCPDYPECRSIQKFLEDES